jgi:hypothetical protein
MLLPKYSIRTLLLIMVGVALFALLITYALRGSTWTLGVAVAIGSLGFVLLLHAGMFLAIALLAKILPGRKSRAPFATVPRAPLPEAPH